jgi:hypothetical protein
MRISYLWLKDLVRFPLSPQELAELLTMAGLEVEALWHRYPHLKNVIAVRIDSVEPHPDADRLSICSVSNGPVYRWFRRRTCETVKLPRWPPWAPNCRAARSAKRWFAARCPGNALLGKELAWGKSGEFGSCRRIPRLGSSILRSE